MLARSVIWLIGWGSLLACWLLFREWRTLCARAHGRPEAFWRAWVRAFDWLLRWLGDDCHCERQARQWRYR